MKTPQQSSPALAAALGLANDVYLKREDLHPYGSHKGRSIPLMIKTYAKQGIAAFVISSSGNAALAAVRAVEQHNKNNPNKEISLRVFVGEHIHQKKLSSLAGAASATRSVTVEQTENPKQRAFQMDAAGEAKYLRQSTDDLALEGYIQLADELGKVENLAAVFIPTSSGTTAEGLARAFAAAQRPVQIHIVQTAACHPMVDDFLPEDRRLLQKDGESIAGAIVDRVAHRKERVVDAVRGSHGMGWMVSDDEIKNAVALVKTKTGLDISPNSALAVAGLAQAVREHWTWQGPVVCLLTGP